MNAWTELIRHTLRSIFRHPVYSLFAVITIAITIGGVALVASLGEAIAYQSLPVDRPDELVSVREMSTDATGRTENFGRLSLEDFETLRDAAAPLSQLGAWATGEAILRTGNRTERAEVQWVDGRYFDILGVRMARGRAFLPADDREAGGAGGVVLTHDAWERLFARDPEVTRRSIDVDGVARPVIGVAPTGFRGFQVGADPVLFALASDVPPNWAFFRVFGRLKPGATATSLEASLGGAHRAMRDADPDRTTFMIGGDGKSSEANERIVVAEGSRGESQLRGEAMLPLALVGGLLVIVLLVLGANLANLLAVRALSERGSAAIRLALGAPRHLLLGGWIVESLLLTLSGAAIGLAAVARFGESLLLWTPLPRWARGLEPVVDAKEIAISSGLAVAVAVVVGSLAAWQHRRIEPTVHLRESAATTTLSRSGSRWRSVLIASQVALSVVLLVAMGLFARSAALLLEIETGLPLERVATFRVDVPQALAADAADRVERLAREIESIPGVAAAGYSTNAVLGGVRGYRMGSVEGYQPEVGEVMMLNTIPVSEGFFSALEIPLLSGTYLGESTHGERGVIVNRHFATKYFGGNDPVGRRVSFQFQRGDWSEPRPDDMIVVGVVDDRMMSDVREAPVPRIYPKWTGSSTATFYVRSPDHPLRHGQAIERLARTLLPEAATGPIGTLAEQRDRSLRRELLTRDLTVVFGLVGATLAAFGLFSVVSFVARERKKEYGLRQALGARPDDLVRHVLRDGLRPVVVGLVVGLVIAALLTRFASTQLYGVEALDPLSFAWASVGMLLVAAVACLPAAIRAAGTDPARVLRAE